MLRKALDTSKIPFQHNSHFTSIILTMSGNFDLNLLPLHRLAGQDQPELPGLYAVTPPRHPARGRDADHLVLYLTVTGELGLLPEQRTKLFERLAQTYYKSSGTVTAAMKGVAEALNAALLERNLQSSSSGRQGIGWLTQVVLRGEVIYLAHSGPVHAFLARPQENQHWYDPQGAGRGLGLARIATVRFYQTSLQQNDFLLLAHQPAEVWGAEGLTIAPNQGLESLRRKLLSQAGPNLNAVLIQVQAGTGKLRVLRLKPAFQDMAHSTPVSRGQGTAVEVKPVSVPVAGQSETAPVENELLPMPAAVPMLAPEETATQVPVSTTEGNAETTIPETPAAVLGLEQAISPSTGSTLPQPQVKADRITISSPAGAAQQPVKAPSTTTKKKQPAMPSAVGQLTLALKKAFQELKNILKHTLTWLFGGLISLIKRTLPDESLLNISPGTMIFFALAIPILISVVGGMVYIRRGQQRQYEAYFQQAQEAARQAAAMTDPAEQRAAWDVTLEYLDKAEFYQKTEESQSLRAQAQESLDQLDAIERLDYQPALLDKLDDGVQITRVVADSGEIYLLNSTQGNVYRAILTGQGYDLDPSFQCGPQAAAGTIGQLVDITPLPKGDPSGASILGMDLNGGLIYCTPGDDPTTTVLAPPPMNFSNPKAFDYDAGDLFIIDPPNKAVWVYRNMEIDQPPHQFLGDITSFMVDVIDMAVNGDDIYLLHSNGGMTKCTYSWTEGVPTRCEDPFVYTDNRPGRTGGEVIPDALFDQIAYSPPPDPSLYLLDPQNQAIYHFSLRLNLDRQYRPLQPLADGPATAFAISPTRLAFLAIGNQVYYAALP
jgi:hypothetical protein